MVDACLGVRRSAPGFRLSGLGFGRRLSAEMLMRAGPAISDLGGRMEDES